MGNGLLPLYRSRIHDQEPEAVAIAFLQDRIRTYNEDFPGYTLTKFNGQKIRINPDGTITNL